MKYFKITIMQKGRKSDETVKALNRMSAIAQLKEKMPNIIVTSAVETSPPLEDTITNLLAGLKKNTKRKIPAEAKISTIRQIAVMTDAGIAINDTLRDVAENTENKVLKEIFFSMNSDINAGSSMSASIKKYTDEFGHVAIAMTELGERTGNLSQSYHKLADILENIRDNVSKFKKAIRTPLITLTAMGIAFTILIMVVVPKFKEIFEKLGADLPLPTIILLKLEYAFSNFGLYILLAGFAAVSMLKYFYQNNDDFKYKVDKILIHPRFYLINKAIFLSTMHQYNLVFGELVKAGVPVNEALDTAVGMVTNAAIKEQLLTVNANIGRGMSLAEAFEQTALYENMLLQMIKAGESGGQLDAMLDKVTDYYDMRFQDLIDNLSSYIEPIMMFFIAGLVLLMALGIFMPMWDLASAAK